METVTITKSEYQRLKKLEDVDQELLNRIIEGLEDIKHGRIRKFE